MDDKDLPIPVDYGPFLEDLKERIRLAQVEAAASVNSELVKLYWNLGRRIYIAQRSRGWGAKIIPRLSIDLVKAFPGMKGFSPRNLDYMLAFSKAWPEEAISQQPLRNLPWGHHLHLLQALADPTIRSWYAEKALSSGWSRNVLALQIKSRLHERQGAAPTNFAATIPAPQSDLAANLLKDPYNFDFLCLGMRPANARSKTPLSLTFGNSS